MNQTQTQEKIIEIRDLEYRFTDSELQEMGRELSEKVIDHVKVELEKKEITKVFNDQIKAKMKLIKQLSYKIDSGYEVRDVSCEVYHNMPVYGKKTIMRMDTQETWIEDMTDDEFNLFNQDGAKIFSIKPQSTISWEEE